MYCYKDMTFCSYYKECKDGKKCFRALTEEVSKKAEDFGAPICQFVGIPDCFKPKN